MDVGECADFTFDVLVSCDAELGQTHCTEAHIFPDSLCIPPINWSGAQIEVNGACQNDTIYFNIQNVGDAPTSQPLDFIVIEDDVILMQGNIDILNPQEVEQYYYPARALPIAWRPSRNPMFPVAGAIPPPPWKLVVRAISVLALSTNSRRTTPARSRTLTVGKTWAASTPTINKPSHRATGRSISSTQTLISSTSSASKILAPIRLFGSSSGTPYPPSSTRPPCALVLPATLTNLALVALGC